MPDTDAKTPTAADLAKAQREADDAAQKRQDDTLRDARTDALAYLQRAVNANDGGDQYSENRVRAAVAILDHCKPYKGV